MNNDRPTHVQVVHEEPIMGAGIVALLDGARDVVATHTTLAQAFALLEHDATEPCDLLVADYTNALSLAAAARRARLPRPTPRVLTISAQDREWDVQMAMEAGIHGYVLQKCGREQLLEAVRAVVRGGKYLSMELTSKLAESLTRDRLTSRQMEVLRAMCTGASNRDISESLGIADGTVKSHVSAILSKFGAVARTEAVAIAVERGLLPRHLDLTAVYRLPMTRSSEPWGAR